MFKGILLKSRSISILLLVKTPTLSRYFHLTEIMPFKKEKNSHRKIIIERKKKYRNRSFHHSKNRCKKHTKETGSNKIHGCSTMATTMREDRHVII
jgi:hypothetical protein